MKKNHRELNEIFDQALDADPLTVSDFVVLSLLIGGVILVAVLVFYGLKI